MLRKILTELNLQSFSSSFFKAEDTLTNELCVVVQIPFAELTCDPFCFFLLKTLGRLSFGCALFFPLWLRRKYFLHLFWRFIARRTDARQLAWGATTHLGGERSALCSRDYGLCFERYASARCASHY